MKLTLLHGDREYHVETLSDGRVRIGDRVFDASRGDAGVVRINGRDAWVALADNVRWVFWEGRAYELTERRQSAKRRGSGHHGGLFAPMPATVRRILVARGDAVEAGDSLVVLEAMKMELPVRAPSAGKVRAVNCREGELVQPGVALVELE